MRSRDSRIVTGASKGAALTAVALLVAVASLPGCGGGASGLSASEVTAMGTQLAAARTAAASGNRSGVDAALQALTRQITLARSRGQLSPERARTLLVEVSQAQARVAVDVPAAPAAAPTPGVPPSGLGVDVVPSTEGDQPQGPDGAPKAKDGGDGGD